MPPALLGRVSSLDFFVSLAFIPLSMALAGPVSAAVGLGTTFVVAGLVPVVAGTAALLLARLPRDELANPIAPAAGEPTGRVTTARPAGRLMVADSWPGSALAA